MMNGDACYPRDGYEHVECCGKKDFIRVNVYQESFCGVLVDTEFDAKCIYCGRIVSTFSYGAWGV